MVMKSNGTCLSSVVFVDIVGYSNVSLTRQIEMKEHLNRIITDAIHEVDERDRIVVDSGDGAALCFLGDPEDALFSALKLRDGFMTPRENGPQYDVRIGINVGLEKAFKDINGWANMLGDGINVAQRVMAFAKNNQVLVSRSFYEAITALSQDYAELFNYQGVHKDKHGHEHPIYEVNLPNEAQILAAPDRLAGEDAPAQVGDVPVAVDTGSEQRDTAAAGWDPNMLLLVERALANFVGPLAKLLVKRASAAHDTREGLFDELAHAIEDELDKRAFLRKVHSVHGVAPVETDATTGDVIPEGPEPRQWDADTLTSLEHHLASHVGPIAKVLVKRAARRASSLDELRQTLAEELPGENDKRGFLRATS